MGSMRHELKYMLTPVQYALLQSRIKCVMEPDAHVSESGEYFIRSVYFDSPDRIAWREKISGVNERKKYRIRFYNADTSYCNLECKIKTGTRITKTSQAIDRRQMQMLLDADASQLAQEGLLGELKLLLTGSAFAPVVTVDYVREPYVLPFSDLRITFDKEVAWGDVRDCTQADRSLAMVYGDRIILEVKYNMYLPEHISDMLSSVRPVQTAASKYTACLEEKYRALGY